MVTQNAPVPCFTGSGLFSIESRSRRRGLQHSGEDFGQRVRAREPDADPPHRFADQRTHLEQLETKSVELPAAQVGAYLCRPVPHRRHQPVRRRVQAQSEGVGDVAGAGQPVSGQGVFEVLDAILAFAAGAVGLIDEPTGKLCQR